MSTIINNQIGVYMYNIGNNHPISTYNSSPSKLPRLLWESILSIIYISYNGSTGEVTIHNIPNGLNFEFDGETGKLTIEDTVFEVYSEQFSYIGSLGHLSIVDDPDYVCDCCKFFRELPPFDFTIPPTTTEGIGFDYTFDFSFEVID